MEVLKKKLSIQYREPVRRILKLSELGDHSTAHLLIDLLCEVDMRVITVGDDVMRDLKILQRIRSVIVVKTYKS